MKQKVIRTGNSLAVTIPSDFCKTVGIKAGSTVRVRTDLQNCQITYTFSGFHQLPLSKNFVKKKKG